MTNIFDREDIREIFVNSLKFSVPVMTLDSRDTQKQGGDAKLPPLSHVLEKIVLMNTFVISYARGLVL